MIIVDTNVVSAVMQERPDMTAAHWLERQRPGDLWTTAITVFEICFGIELLPLGKRRSHLETARDNLFEKLFGSRILMIDAGAAREAARLAAFRKARGINIETNDTMIAGIALANRAVIATRNTRHFADLGVNVIDPWQGQEL